MSKKGDLFLFIYIIGTIACFYIAYDFTFKLSYTSISPASIDADMIELVPIKSESDNKPRPTPDSLTAVKYKYLILWMIVGFIYACYLFGLTFQAVQKSSNIRETVVMCSYLGFIFGIIFGLFPSLLFSIAIHLAHNPGLYVISSYSKIIRTGCLLCGIVGLISGPVALKVRLIP